MWSQDTIIAIFLFSTVQESEFLQLESGIPFISMAAKETHSICNQRKPLGMVTSPINIL